MDLSGIISISGKPGLFKVVAQSKNNIIVESLLNKKRAPAYSTDRISALEDISIYTYEEDIPLKEVFIKFAEKENCGPAPSHKESAKKLATYLEEVLPDYDEDRVYPSDIKKLYQWYNLLQKEGLITLEESEEKEDTTSKKKEKKSDTAKKVVKKESKTKTEKKSPQKKSSSKTTTSAKKKTTTTKKTTTKKTEKK